ncbi:LPXTG cell wall anchor domain-containing protein [Micromonospora zingiberis]|uniref:LPXTG cell wall anchor domain-containing protein n=1 Tax=Micromonospora zingiberis TaxID=2053011 RepID=A0A4R0GAY9_9ACTN|nr:LPXTG cell wall anchor domain-containing protein [Micromonospora zingiberis]TCB93567.1 LPXTG cell wall anchor domain-containing protein [Micromonospora zingiberis]
MDPEPKFTFDLNSTTAPLGIEKKRIFLRFTNLTTDETPTAWQFNVRPTDPDSWQKASVEWPGAGTDIGECDGEPDHFYCYLADQQYPELMPAPGGTVEIPLNIRVREKNEPYEGTFVVTAHAYWDDERSPDIEKTFTLKIVDDSEADLSVIAPDVKQSVRVDAGGRLEATGPLNPGETGAVRYQIVNQGRKPVSGVKVTLGLPKGVTFTQPPEECATDDDGRSAVCTYDTLALVPVGADTDPKDDIHSAVELVNLVTVSTATKAPVTLQGGTVQVEGLIEEIDAKSDLVRTKLPVNAVAVPAADVDASDNQDGFSVVVAARRSGGDDGGSGGGGNLPITGSQTGLITGIGLVMLAGGGIMLLLARRRNRLPHA